MDLKARIAKAKAMLSDAEPAVVPVEIGGELTDISFRPVQGRVWADMTAMHPPRRGAVLDGNVGFNSDAVARAYPLDHILVDGEPLRTVDPETGNAQWDEETWAELNDALTNPGIKLIAAALWGINQKTPQDRANALGKARASAAQKKPNSR